MNYKKKDKEKRPQLYTGGGIGNIKWNLTDVAKSKIKTDSSKKLYSLMKVPDLFCCQQVIQRNKDIFVNYTKSSLLSQMHILYPK